MLITWIFFQVFTSLNGGSFEMILYESDVIHVCDFLAFYVGREGTYGISLRYSLVFRLSRVVGVLWGIVKCVHKLHTCLNLYTLSVDH